MAVPLSAGIRKPVGLVGSVVWAWCVLESWLPLPTLRLFRSLGPERELWGAGLEGVKSRELGSSQNMEHSGAILGDAGLAADLTCVLGRKP